MTAAPAGKRCPPAHALLTAAVRLPSGEIVVTGAAGTVLRSDGSAKRFELTSRADRLTITGAVPLGAEAIVLVGEFGVEPLRLAPGS